MNLYQITETLLRRKQQRTSIGWVDLSACSRDCRECERRAYRIILRTRGIRSNHWGEDQKYTLAGRRFGVLAIFEDTDGGTAMANRYMYHCHDAAVLHVARGYIILADKNDLGVVV